ncbi:TIGR03086 family metal-binding protein [Pseudonocardia kunmingensis]|uniref:Uncharacterized protein (TIGR03086 family) n=1 Tax=Pseudonocardia kunmingensis TaxID=630975 RepID=A0A543DA57_9PSEU|nr:TIGR03086 family metal-binding protein [Pseudonocardia kunmingensis]TQM06200.1 uncharacterized protein (TIGR03086 family) [Pseudonocardia kunmingensis]
MNDSTERARLDDLAEVLGIVGELVGAVRDDRWSAPTPCPEWDVRALVDHMVLGHRLFAGILRGEAAVTAGALDPGSADALGDDPAGAYGDAARDLLAAFGRPGVLGRTFEVPVGPVPGIVAVHLRIVEELVHGWDLAQAAGGGRPRFPDDVAERAVGFTRVKLADVPPEQSPFAPPQPVSDLAPQIDRLAALLGRTVGQGSRAPGPRPADSETPARGLRGYRAGVVRPVRP